MTNEELIQDQSSKLMAAMLQASIRVQLERLPGACEYALTIDNFPPVDVYVMVTRASSQGA